MDGPAFDFLQVHAVAREGFERAEKRARLVRKPESDGHFVGVSSRDLRCRLLWNQQNKTSEILGIVLNVFGQNDPSVDISGAARRDSRERFVAARNRFAHAAGGIFTGDALQVRMGEEKLFALRERDRMRRNGAKIGKRSARAADELMLNVQNGFRDDRQVAFDKQVVNANDGAGERIFDGGEESIGVSFGNCAERRVECRTRNGGDGSTEELNGGAFAERAALALERNAGRF